MGKAGKALDMRDFRLDEGVEHLSAAVIYQIAIKRHKSLLTKLGPLPTISSLSHKSQADHLDEKRVSH